MAVAAAVGVSRSRVPWWAAGFRLHSRIDRWLLTLHLPPSDTLCSYSDGRSALEAAMQKWCERQIEVRPVDGWILGVRAHPAQLCSCIDASSHARPDKQATPPSPLTRHIQLEHTFHPPTHPPTTPDSHALRHPADHHRAGGLAYSGTPRARRHPGGRLGSFGVANVVWAAALAGDSHAGTQQCAFSHPVLIQHGASLCCQVCI